MPEYYVYEIIDPRTEKPFYIGKGKGLRAWSHLNETKENTENKRKFNKIQSIKKKNLEPIINIIQNEMEEENAYNLETELIKKHGRLGYDIGGILTNICEDNRPPNNTGKTMPREGVIRGALKRSGEKHHYFGKSLPDSTKKALSQKLSGENNPFYGKTHTEETKQILSEKRQGVSIPHTSESKQKISDALKGKKKSISHIEKHKESLSKTNILKNGLTWNIIDDIRSLYQSGILLKEIGIKYPNLKHWTLTNIALNRSYKK